MILSFHFLDLEVEESLVLRISCSDSIEAIWAFLFLLLIEDCGREV